MTLFSGGKETHVEGVREEKMGIGGVGRDARSVDSQQGS